MQSNYQYALQQVLKSEGGYTNDPRDPGGPTNYGITIADYRMYINKKATSNDVKNMHLSDAMSIYRTKYWNAVNGDKLPSGVDYAVFDYAVNSGVSRALRVYKSLATKYSSPVDLINAICNERLAFLRSLSTYSHFGAGWSSRVASVRSNSIKLATGQTNVTHGTAGAVVVAGGAAVYHWYDYWPYIAAGGLATIALIYLGYYLYRKHHGTNVQ